MLDADFLLLTLFNKQLQQLFSFLFWDGGKSHKLRKADQCKHPRQ